MRNVMGFYAFQERGIRRNKASMAGVWVAITLTPEQRKILQSTNFGIVNQTTGQVERIGQIGVKKALGGTAIKVTGHFKTPAQVKRAAIELKNMVYSMLKLKTIGCRLSNYWLMSRTFSA